MCTSVYVAVSDRNRPLRISSTSRSLTRYSAVASSPGPSQILSRSHGEKSGEGLGSKLRHGPEMVDSVSTNRVHVTY